MKRIWAFLAFMVFLSLSFFVFPVGASSTVLQGETQEIGTGTKSPDNPYRLVGTSPSGLPRHIGPLYGDGMVNDTYDTATGIEIRRWKRMELDGTENWQTFATQDNSKWRNVLPVQGVYMPENSSTLPDLVCTHYLVDTSGNNWRCIQSATIDASNADLLSIYDNQYNAKDPAAWKAYLAAQKAAGTPVTVVYRLAEPEVVKHDLSTVTDYKIQNFGLKDVSSIEPMIFNGSVSVSYTDQAIALTQCTSTKFQLILSADEYFFFLKSGEKYKSSIAFSFSGFGSPMQLTINRLYFRSHESSTDFESYTPISGPLQFDSDHTNAYLEYTTGQISSDFLCRYIVLEFSVSNPHAFYITWHQGLIEQLDPYASIVDGNGTPLAPDPGADGAMDDIGNAEDAALGGKTDEQIKQEVDNALNFDMGSLDQSAAAAMAGFFDGLLTHFGVDYQALLLLSLSLGLAAFIIGRRYKV